ncbi:hypothetical protein J3459_008613 [Metarhizium acridum]|nr:hypothetical protein J3459_008613 [Metarhizium acridum]
MGNVRIDSLPANRRVAAHCQSAHAPRNSTASLVNLDPDCPTCIRRRIKCDRTEPSCMKCASRGLECPGFQTVYLKWNQGIASRGRLAGKSVPIAKGTRKPVGKDESSGGQRRAGKDRQQPSNTSSLAQDAPTTTVYELTPALSPQEAKHVVDPFLSISIFNRLVDHFCTKAVSRLTWIDRPRHPLRTIVRRLLQTSACVKFSVGSLAAAHMSMVLDVPHHQSKALFKTYVSLRDKSMQALSNKLRSGLPTPSNVAPSASTNCTLTEVLASMLVLCYTEVLVPGSRAWRLHLRGCRAVIDLQSLEHWFAASTDPIIRFLLKEVSDLEMFTGISMFHQDFAPLPKSPPQPASTDTGWAFTKLIYAITALERERHCLRQSNAPPPNVDIRVWCNRAEEARISSLACTDWLNESQRSLRASFEAVARAHYFAAIIYSYQAFQTWHEKKAALPGHLQPLLADVRFVMAGPTDELFHDLFFPLFIAGTESASDPLMRSEIDGLFLESLSRTGVWCNYSALQFLRSFWSATSTLQEPMNWMDFARQNLSVMEPFIVF